MVMVVDGYIKVNRPDHIPDPPDPKVLESIFLARKLACKTLIRKYPDDYSNLLHNEEVRLRNRIVPPKYVNVQDLY